MDSFDWMDYLKNNDSVAIPETFFTHVEMSLSNGIKEGMIFEVCHKTNPDVYWLGEVTMACGHLLRVKLVGSESDFWCDITNIKGHSIGWCPKNDELIDPPADISKKYGNRIINIMTETLSKHESVSDVSLDNKGLAPIDRIKQGMKVEVQDTIDPYRYWIATIQENVGGRLLLSYDEADNDLPKFWIFYSNPRLASFGFVTNKGSPWHFKYPGKVNRFACRNRLSSLLRVCAEESIKDPTPHDLFGPNNNIPAHNFVDTMKVEALDPHDMKTVRPATVVNIYSNYEFLVVIDDHRNDYQDSRMAWICHSMHPYIYPLGWAQKNDVPFMVPKIWKKDSFDWDEYLSMTSSVPAPEYCFGTKELVKEITKNMMLEAVNPLNYDEIHVARVKSVVEHMICVELLPTGECHWYAQNSDLLFPVGWCDSNNYELHIPNTSAANEPTQKSLEVEKDEIKLTEEWCDRIFFNYKCYAGPMISRNKLSQLPKHVGPGPLSLVLKEVLNKIISASYKPAKLLKDWETEGPAAEGMRLETLKAKLKTSTYYASVEIATTASQISSFCKSMCIKLQSCPHLFGPTEFVDQCPENCQQVDKSKFQNNSEKRGRPRGSKKKKKKGVERIKGLPLLEVEVGLEGAESLESEHSCGSSPHSEPATRPNSPDSLDYKKLRLRRKPKNEYPKLEMKTRGAKLPNFALQIKEAHWDKKDVETIYNNTCIPKKQSTGSDTENESSRSSHSRDAKHIFDVSDSEEPELKKLKFTSDEPQPSDNKIFEKNISMPWLKEDLKLSSNPLDWSISDVYTYLSNTEDCKLIAEKMRQEEIDGQAFIMLDLPTVKEFLHIRQEFALKLCKHISMLKWYYIVNFEEGLVETR
ncbi:Scm-like with four MBT domains protein 2 [Eumeta japonica]|uniref:Scm-like with four MBT domains protein 2 n=1 Tax=Eumeta variegata TaxID=151549 RepID=A0A4C1WNR6_EUMVA|nr:Scm-like with four MBT domains protein 2 [Eumeta japonica]